MENKWINICLKKKGIKTEQPGVQTRNMATETNCFDTRVLIKNLSIIVMFL